ncbi:MAG: hypothetical protein M1336_01895 [Deltaproteobacteria bacterium]|jgi:hypothetical protein|nr:hypothetical protein [Deltaproteobacteria bacterium]
MPTLTDQAEFTSNEIYEIQQTDAEEGAGVGASYSGIGLSNWPHQQLANRTAFLKQRQDQNIASISALQAFEAGFLGLLAPNGYLKIPLNDAVKGPLICIAQWGTYAPVGAVAVNGPTSYAITWPIVFPNACLWALATVLDTRDVAAGYGADDYGVSTLALTQTQGNFYVNANGADGFQWLAIGY